MQLKDLNEKVKKVSENLSHTAWIAHQQRENMDRLTYSGRGSDSNPSVACLRANLLEQTVFKDAYKELNYQETLYSDFVRSIRSRPQFLSHCLTAGDKLSIPQVVDIISILFGGIYGSCLMPDDEQLVLRLLNHLMRSQLTSASNPRKLLRQKSCAFTRLYKIFSEELFSAKLFLTSALYEPILSLLSDDEIFLDIDPSKAAIRFAPSERLRKFGKEGTPSFVEKLKSHRSFIVNKLVHLTSNFIKGIRENLHCFPPSLARLLRAMYSLLMSSGKAEPKEVHAVCVDAIFTLFICPAMVDPNPVGIIDTPISYIARSNLMQVAQILQVLAMGRFEDATIETNPAHDLYSKFEKEVVSSLLEAMLESAKDLAAADVNKLNSTSCDSNINECGGLTDLLMVNDPAFIEGMEDSSNSKCQTENPSTGQSSSVIPEGAMLDTHQSGLSGQFSRISVLMTRNQLETLINFFRSLHKTLLDDLGTENLKKDVGEGIDMIELESLISPLPNSIPGGPVRSKSNSPTKSLKASSSNVDLKGIAQAKKQQLTNKLSTVIRQAGNISPSISSSSLSTEGASYQGSCTSTQNPKAKEQCNDNGLDHDGVTVAYGVSSKSHTEPEIVLVIPLNDANEGNSRPPGFLSEEHVLERSRAQRVIGNRAIIRSSGQTHVTGAGGRVVRMNLPGHDISLHGTNESNSNIESSTGAVHLGGPRINNIGDGTPSSVGEKRTRFSLTHDDGSIGNTSDNLEAISEAASNHSVASSLEDEVDQDNVDPDDPLQIIDNLSDMVSANVSGRGTPNVSGRDTPSSQVTEGDELVGGVSGGGGSEAGEGTSAAGAESGTGIGSGSETEGVSVVMDGRENSDAPPVNEVINNEVQEEGSLRRISTNGGVVPLRGSGTSRGGARERGGKNRSGLPKGKNGEPDLEEKFGRFEIKPQGSRATILGPTSVGSVGGCVGSEQGDETVSMISDTWSTDVLASDTESYYNAASTRNGSAGGVEELLIHRRPPMAEIGDLMTPSANAPRIASSNSSSTLTLRQLAPTTSSSAQTNSLNPFQVPSGPSFASLLDIAETTSEAWSIDVLASDTESLRLGELDTEEDTMSVARSDDTRFTDDTTRSDPEQILEMSSNIGNNVLGANTRRQDDVTMASKSSKGNSNQITQPCQTANMGENNLLRPSRAAAVEQWARQSSAGNRLVGSTSARRGSDNSAGSGRHQDNASIATGSILKKAGSMMASGGSSGGSSREHPSSVDADDVVSDLIDIAVPLQQPSISEVQRVEYPITCELSPGIVRVTSTPSNLPPRQGSIKDPLPTTYGTAYPDNSAINVSSSTISTNNNSPYFDSTNCPVSHNSFGNFDRDTVATPIKHSSEGLEVSISSCMTPSTTTVNSTSNNSDGAEARKKSDAVTDNKNKISSATTGAIPKSISFDTAQNQASSMSTKGSRDKSFFPKSWKLPKIGKSRGGHGGSGKFKSDEQRGNSRNANDNPRDISRDNLFQRLPSDEASSASDGGGQMNAETSDDILEKYRVKGRTQHNANISGLSHSNEIILGTQTEDSRRTFDSGDSVFQERIHGCNNESLSLEDDEDIESASTAARKVRSVEDTYAFQDAKRKLRLMLAEVNFNFRDLLIFLYRNRIVPL